eukprot:CAMPEP_0175973396 /NCGR_PEP_ID=MMETSP0108-20121206/42772_1 /TAXON_ID=195067 ORGANISM="Goniomonas pacifica, Strain CCMP1869" /NCGR_SAMPLE_ID=MMETSP0108 /ASSEMBLY_ACC=CAM_ASM_000204 /LENGTH=64 /DNA_ID=CAMNT_0017302841 /DNA_START=83 /DNA_END=273 /DNA_ORIENTATION=-
MGREPNGYTVINIAPLGMVIGAFGEKCNLCHEAECFNKRVKAPLSYQPIRSNGPGRARGVEALA